MPSSGTLKVLFIYLQFPDDNYLPDSPNWPKGGAPTYMSATVDQTWSANATPGGFTDYFNQMSFNSLKVIGTSVSRVTPNTRQHYLDYGLNSTDIYTEVLQQLDQTMDFAQFDNWRWSVEYTLENSPDNVVDMILMMWRDIHSLLPYDQRRDVQGDLNLVPGGEASLGGDYDPLAPPIYVDGGLRRIEMRYPANYVPFRPGSGVTVIQPDVSDLSFGTFWTYARHEFAHYLLGGNEYHTPVGTWGMLNGWGSPSQCINSFERYKLGWINFNDITDITTPRTISGCTLPDFVSTGIAYRIRVPGGAANEYYLLENHQRASAFDVPDNNVPTAKGLYVLRQQLDRGDGVGIVSADGRYNWTVPEVLPNNYGSNPATLPVFLRGGSNRVGGYTKRQRIPWTYLGVPHAAEAIHYYRDAGGVLRQAPPTIFTGDGRDQFIPGFKTVFTPASNPSSDLYGNANKIGFEVTGLANGIVTTSIFINQVESGAPSRPEDLSGTKNATLAASLSWLGNAENDVQSGGSYKVYRAIYYSGGPTPTYSVLATIPSSPTSYVDNNWDGVSVPAGSTSDFRYRVSAVDNTGRESVLSDSVQLSYSCQEYLLGLAHQNKSQSSQSTSFNGQRKLYRDTSGKLHEVFASGTVTGGEIFYRNSTNGGTSWSNAVRLSDGTATSLAPCITMSSATTNVIVTWQQTNGSNYNVVFRRSTNGGTAWGSITTLQSNFSCGSPGPLPSVSGNTQTGRVVVVYRSSSGLRYVASSNNMTSWTAPTGVPGSTSGNHNSPSTAYYANDVNNCNLAFATDVAGYSSVINYCSYSGTWSPLVNLSSVIPSSYQQQRNPSVATTTSIAPPLCHVAWEALLIPPMPVLIHRKGTSGNFGSQYSVINSQQAMNPSIAGLGGDNAWMVFQNTQMGRVDRVRYSYVAPQWVWGTPSSGPTGNYGQISVGSSTAKYLYTSGTATPYTVSLGSESLTKEDVPVAQYSRELNLINAESGASLTLEIEQAEILHKDGTITAVPFKDAPPDSLLIPVEEIFTYGEMKPFAFSSPTDTLRVRYTVRSAKAEEVLAEEAGAAYTFTLRERKTGEVLSTLEAVPVAKTAGMTSAVGEITLSGIQIQGLQPGAELILEVSLSGVKEGQDVIASLGHIYRYSGEGAAELPKPVAEEQSGPKSYHLEQNYPNPFNPSTTIRYGLPEAAHVRLIVYNTLGQQVADLVEGERTAGYHEVRWEAAGLASGIYFARLTVTGGLGQNLSTQTAKLVFMK